MSHDSRLGDLRRRVNSDPTSIAFAALAEEYRRAGQPDEAVAVCRAGLQRHPAYLSARVTLGRALLDLRDFDGAEAELEQVLKIAPDNLAAIRALSDLHQQRDEGPRTSPSFPPSRASESNVIPFEPDLMPLENNSPDAPVLSPMFEMPEGGPVLMSLGRFLDAIVSLKRAAL